ncbi:MAG TPA: non-homologous end-joining DNA ligase [Bryobacteraceae bacterium]
MAAANRQVLEIEGRAVPVTNLDKPLFPSGFTKGQLIDYYIRVSDHLLPHVRNRPITLKRYPDGVQEPHFYEKDAPKYTPPWVETFAVARRGGGTDIRYVLLNDLASLVWAANLANIEMHPFLAAAPDLERPLCVVFDLDPGEGAGILVCAGVAFLLKEALEERGLESFAKVSGSKGIQVYAPLNTKATYAETQPFARARAQELERQHPALVISDMSKSVRRGKIFIDWSQNSDFKTTVAVYSLRAKREKPFVSMPVRWEELRTAMRRSDAESLYFEPEAALERLAGTGDLFEPVLNLKQKLSAAGKKRPAAPRAQEKLEFVEPMRAKLTGKLPEGREWIYEIKFDGYRAEAIKQGGEVTLYSRNHNVLNRQFPKIAEALRALPDGVMLDGEIIALNSEGRPSFNALQNYQSGRPIFYFVFDLLALRGRKLLGEPLLKRRELLEKLALSDPVRLSDRIDARASELVAATREQGLEGIVAKLANSVYEPGARSGAWVKFKVNRGQELVIGGYIPGSHGFQSLLAGYYDEGRLLFIAKVKNGFTPHSREQVARRFRGRETDVCPFANLPEPKNARRGEALTAEVMKKCRWLRPELVAQVEYTDWTAANHLRHSRFAGLREDKDAREVVKEEPGGYE